MTTDPLYIKSNTVKHHHHHHFLPNPIIPYNSPTVPVFPYTQLPKIQSTNNFDSDLLNSSVMRAIAEANDHTSEIKTKK
jgi:hypothetical protein